MAEIQLIYKLFEEREKSIKDNLLKEVEKVAEREMKLFEFELFYSLLIQNEETTKWVKEKRRREWKEALKQAGGDWDKAMTTFAS